MSDYIITYKNIKLVPTNPNKEDIDIEDIAHALSMMTRANGHFPEFYSVAQHCIACAKEATAREFSKRVVLGCLLHDASEAYIADITRPVKPYLNNYMDIEKVLQDLIYETFLDNPLSQKELEQIKRMDDLLLFHEFYFFKKIKLFEEKEELRGDISFGTQAFKEVEEEYLGMFRKLTI